jgi:hypothetical protein
MDPSVEADSATNRKASVVGLSPFGRHHIPEHMSEYAYSETSATMPNLAAYQIHHNLASYLAHPQSL